MNTFIRINILSLLLFVSVHYSGAQDIIVDIESDSIECKITKLDNDFVFYTLPPDYGEEMAYPRYKVKELYYAGKRIDFSERLKEKKYIIFKQPEWRADAGMGYAYFLEVPFEDFGSDYQDFFRGLRNGRTFYAEIAKYPDLRFGGGLEFQYSGFTNSEDGLIIFDSTGVFKDRGRVSENVDIYYLQPKGYFSIFSSTWDFTAGGGIVLAHLRRDLMVLDESYEFRGVSMGIALSTAIDRKVSSSFAIGIRASLGLVFLSQVRLNGRTLVLEEEDYFSASQFTLAFGFKYLF